MKLQLSQAPVTSPELVVKARTLGFDECAFFDRPLLEQNARTSRFETPRETIPLVASNHLGTVAASVAFQLKREEYLKDIKRSLRQTAKRFLAGRIMVKQSNQASSLLDTSQKMHTQQILTVSDSLQTMLHSFAQVRYIIAIMSELFSILHMQIV